jgi:hypothetical protein
VIVHAFAFVIAANPALVVEVSAEHDHALARQVRGALVTRLLEEGYDVVPPAEPADARVEVALGESWSLAVDRAGADHRSQIEVGARPVLELELGHRVLLALEDVQAETDPAGAALAIRGTGAGAEPFLYEVIEQAGAAGVRLTGRPSPDDALVCASSSEGSASAEVSVGLAREGCGTHAVTVAADERAGFAARGVVDSALSRAAAAPSVQVHEAERAPRTSARMWLRDDLVALRGPPRAEWRLGVDGGVASRGPADAVVHTWTRLGKYAGPGGRFDLLVIPSARASASMVDTIMMAGPDWQVPIRRRARVNIGAAIGADVHVYDVGDSKAAHVTWTVGMPADVSWGLGDSARVHLALLAGITGASPRHAIAEQTWRRTAWRIGAPLGVSYGWRIE